MRDLYRQYKTPAGCHDVPFIYVFDATALPDSATGYTGLNVQMDNDSEFLLRRIAGVGTFTNFFAYRNASGSYFGQPNIALAAAQADISVAPEKSYKGRETIRFDTGATFRRHVGPVSTDYVSYIAFQGAKRFPWDINPAPCPYRLRSFTYTINIPSVDWTRGQFRRFSKRIENTGDWEMYRIVQTNGTDVPDIRVGVFSYMLYDPNGWQMMSAPVPDGYIIDQTNGILVTDGDVALPNLFPVPGMLYPRMSQIVVDLYALQSIPQGDCWQISFDGAERIPLDGAAPVYA